MIDTLRVELMYAINHGMPAAKRTIFTPHGLCEVMLAIQTADADVETDFGLLHVWLLTVNTEARARKQIMLTKNLSAH